MIMKTKTIKSELIIALFSPQSGLLKEILEHKRIGSQQQEFSKYWREFTSTTLKLENEYNAIIKDYQTAISELAEDAENTIKDEMINTVNRQVKELLDQDITIPTISRKLLGLDSIAINYSQNELLESTILDSNID